MELKYQAVVQMLSGWHGQAAQFSLLSSDHSAASSADSSNTLLSSLH